MLIVKCKCGCGFSVKFPWNLENNKRFTCQNCGNHVETLYTDTLQEKLDSMRRAGLSPEFIPDNAKITITCDL